MNSLEKALKIVDLEIDKLNAMSTNPDEEVYPLERSYAGTLAEYIKVLVQVEKNEREKTEAEDLQGKSQEELDKMALEAIKFLKGEKSDKPKSKPRSPKVPPKRKKTK